MANDIIDINVSETVETVAITVNPNLTTVNINQVAGVISQNLQEVTNVGSTTTNSITANSFIKSGSTGTNILLDNGSIIALDSVGGNTNLTPSQTSTNFTINSDTGTDATIPLGNGTLAGASLNNYTTAEQTKLAGIATGAEVNVNADWNATSGDAQILNKPTIPSLSGYVPYTGATTNVNLGEFELKAGQISLDTTPTGTAIVGTTRWNDSLGSSETTLKGGTVVLKNGVDLVARIVNKVIPNTTLTKANYQAVRVSGATGQRLSVELAQGDVDLNSADTIGLITETIATNQEGFIITMGQIEDINTTGSLQGETWSDGDVLYLSPTIAGRLTNIKPTGATGHIVVIGYVEYSHAVHGKIYVKIMNGWELDELHNVYINNPLNNQGLFYETSTQLWKNKSIATVLGYTPANDASVVHLSGDTMTGSLILNANPTVAFGAATKSYVDTLINGIDWKTAANAATTTSLPTYTVSGSGQILTGAVTLGLIDGVTLTANQRLLVKNETSTLTPNNGIYVVTQVNPFILTRSSDANTPALLAEATISVSSGSTLSNTQWHCNPASVPIVIGTTNISFAGIGANAYTFNSPLINTSNVISVLNASDTQNGVVTTGTQTFAGDKTFTGQSTMSSTLANPLIINRQGSLLNSNIEYRNNANSIFAGLTSPNVFAIGTTISLDSTGQFKLFSSTGNVVIQNGGTSTDDGINKLQVTGSIKSTSVNGATAAEMAYLSGVTSAIQTQFSGKQPLATVLTNTTASFTTADETKLDKYPSTATNGKILQGNGTTYVEIDTPTGSTNLTYTAAPTIGTVFSDTGNDAVITLANATNAGLLKPDKFTVLENTSGTNTGDNATNSQYSGLATSKQNTLSGTGFVKSTAGTISYDTNNYTIANTPAITGATNTKITYDSKGLVTAGTTLIATDIPTITQAQVTNLTTDLSNKIAKNVGATYTTNAITTVTTLEYSNIVTKDANTLYFII